MKYRGYIKSMHEYVIVLTGEYFSSFIITKIVHLLLYTGFIDTVDNT